MKYLFLDNFRGFSATWVPIADVNFLVGENSTGKTSILTLLKLLSSPAFFLGRTFADEHLRLGHFSDIVSAHSADKSYFRIGLAWDAPSKKGKPRDSTGWLLTFVEDEGVPKLVRSAFCRGGLTIFLRFEKNGLFFKTDENHINLTAANIRNDVMPRWIAEHSLTGNGYAKLTLPSGFPKAVPPLIALSLIPRPDAPAKKGIIDLAALGDPEDVLFATGIVWIGPVRTKPKRTYDETLQYSPEGEHTFCVIRRMLRSRKDAERLHAYMQDVGRASGLFQDVAIKSFGKGSASPFEVRIVLDGEALNLTNVGYGVSQSLPVLVEILARGHGAWFAIQQPEVHLHPRAQAVVGDVIFALAEGENKHFLIETHSDFLIDRFRMNYKEGKSKKLLDSQVLFFERKDKHNIVTSIPIDSSGALSEQQPESYRAFFVREQMNLLGM